MCQTVVNASHRALSQPSKVGAATIITEQMRQLELKQVGNSAPHPTPMLDPKVVFLTLLQKHSVCRTWGGVSRDPL